MRRKLIYPHRSVRSIPLTGIRVGAAILVAVALTVGTFWFRAALLEQHNQIAAALLRLCAIPVDGTARVDVFEPIGAADVVTTSVFSPGQQPLRVAALFVGAIVALSLIYWRVALARNFIVFLLVLLLAASGLILFAPGYKITSAEFSQIWLRGEVLVWFLLPWFSASLLVILQHTVWPGLVWAVVMQAYGFLWSAVRLAFCLGVLHYSGLLFMPLLWFTLGLLADVLYMVVFLSLSTRVSGVRAWGRRASWQF